MDLINNYTQVWNDILERHGDPRTVNWLLVDGLTPTLLICLAYIIIVEYIGPLFMLNRKPYELRNVLVIYNFSVVALSTYIFYEFLMSGWLYDYSFTCQPVDYSYSPNALRMARVCWWYFISKFIELLDTVFFVLRKKYNQVTFLHVYHHCTMPINWWIGVRFVAGGHSSFHAMLNSFVHIIMYSYYGIAALGPKYHKYLFWKKHMTNIQMIQFFASLIHNCQLFFIDCDYPRVFSLWILFGGIIFVGFFANFYVHEYYLKKRKSSAIADTIDKKQALSTNIDAADKKKHH